MLSVLRSGWNDHSFEGGQTDFPEMCPSSLVFPLKEPRAASVSVPGLQTIVWTEGGAVKKARRNSRPRNLRWVDAASDTRPHTLGLHSTEQLTRGRLRIGLLVRSSGLHHPQPGQSCGIRRVTDWQAKVHEGVDTTPVSAAEKVRLGSHLSPPKPQDTLAEASAWLRALKGGGEV